MHCAEPRRHVSCAPRSLSRTPGGLPPALLRKEPDGLGRARGPFSPLQEPGPPRIELWGLPRPSPQHEGMNCTSGGSEGKGRPLDRWCLARAELPPTAVPPDSSHRQCTALAVVPRPPARPEGQCLQAGERPRASPCCRQLCRPDSAASREDVLMQWAGLSSLWLPQLGRTPSSRCLPRS